MHAERLTPLKVAPERYKAQRSVEALWNYLATGMRYVLDVDPAPSGR
jgi:hypothetical protein